MAINDRDSKQKKESIKKFGKRIQNDNIAFDQSCLRIILKFKLGQKQKQNHHKKISITIIIIASLENKVFLNHQKQSISKMCKHSSINISMLMNRPIQKGRRQRVGKSPQAGMSFDKTDKQDKTKVGGQVTGQFQQPNKKKHKWYPSNQETNHQQSYSYQKQSIFQQLSHNINSEIEKYQLNVFAEIDKFQQQQQEQAMMNQEQASSITNKTDESSIIMFGPSNFSSSSNSSQNE